MSPPPATIPQAIWDTLLGGLIPLFLAAALGDKAAAREAAYQMLVAYSPQTAAELTLAAEIVSFSFHGLEALGQAAAPDLSLNRVVRLRGSAVSLSREAHKSQRKLDQLQRIRAVQPAEQAQPPKAEPVPEATQDAATTGSPGFTAAEGVAARTEAKLRLQAYHKREAAEHITPNINQAQAELAVRSASLSDAEAITRAA